MSIGRNLNTVGSRIKTSREIKGITQEQLGEAVGVDRSHVSRWERDEVVPRGSARLKIANTLDVSNEWLRTGVGQMQPSGPISPELSPLAGAEHIPEAWLAVNQVLKNRGVQLDEKHLTALFIAVATKCVQDLRPATEKDVTDELVRIFTGK